MLKLIAHFIPSYTSTHLNEYQNDPVYMLTVFCPYEKTRWEVFIANTSLDTIPGETSRLSPKSGPFFADIGNLVMSPASPKDKQENTFLILFVGGPFDGETLPYENPFDPVCEQLNNENP